MRFCSRFMFFLERNRFISHFEHKNVCFKIISEITSKSESLDWLWLSSTANQGQKSGQSCRLFQPSVLQLSWSRSDVWHTNSPQCLLWFQRDVLLLSSGLWHLKSLFSKTRDQQWTCVESLRSSYSHCSHNLLQIFAERGHRKEPVWDQVLHLSEEALQTLLNALSLTLFRVSCSFLLDRLTALRWSEIFKVLFMNAGNQHQVPELSVLSWSSTSSLKLLRFIFVFSGFSLHIMNY